VGANRVIGVDLGGTKIAAALVDRSGKIESLSEVPTPTASEDELVAAISKAVEGLVDDDVAAIGVGVPSTIDQASGTAVSSVNIPLTDVPLRTLLGERFGLPCGIENDANAAAIGEWHAGAGRGTRHMIMLTLGTGVGGGLILDGRPYRGALGAAAELGHMVIEHDGRPCQGICTGRGHLEAYATGLAAAADAREVFGPDADAPALLDHAREGDSRALEILDQMGRRLGSAFGSLVNVFNPELIVVGGGWGEAAGELLLAPAREVMVREALSPGRELVRVVPAALGSDAGVVGAGFVGFEALVAK
jgi:glucokinase